MQHIKICLPVYHVYCRIYTCQLIITCQNTISLPVLEFMINVNIYQGTTCLPVMHVT